MSRVKIKPKFRTVVFTEFQMIKARDSKKFPTHREFVEWLFMTQHKCRVENHSLLQYDYILVGKRNIVKVRGQLGLSIVQKA